MNAIAENQDRAGLRSWLDIRTVNPARALTLMATSAIIGLIIAGFALFTAEGTSTLIVPPEDVALVNQQPISRSDYLAQLKTLYGVDVAHATREQRQRVLDDLIREELFVQRGKELDVSGVDPEVRNAMVNAVEQQAAANALTSLPSDAKLQAFYLANRDDYSSDGLMTVRDIVFPAGAADAAARAAAALRSGGQPDAVIAQFKGRDSGKVNGEEFYFAAKIHLGDTLFAAARALSNGGVSAPLTAPDGWHVLYMVSNHPPTPLDFTKARIKVLDDYQRGAMQRTLVGEEGFLRKRANVLIAKDLR
jgi:parvulin-like peptidyl-prolyl isomerase